MRMEQNGILEPAYINPENGYRYYDENNILRIIRNTSLQQLGITQKELNSYYHASDSYSELLSLLEQKLYRLENYIASLKVQLGQESHLSISPYHFPELYCYRKTISDVTDTAQIRPLIWDTVSEMIHKGYPFDSSMHPFICVDASDFIRSDFNRTTYDYQICIPILASESMTTKDSNIIYYPECNTLSTLLYGGSADIKNAFSNLGRIIESRNHRIIGNARIVAIVQSYPGEDVPIEYWVSRVCIPVE